MRAALRFIVAVLALFLPAAVFAQTGTELRLRDQGRMRTFEVASDELLLSRRGSATGEIANEVRSKVEGATIMADFGTRALVKLPKPIDRGRALAGALPAELTLAGSEAQPVLYQKGLARGAATRRYVSREVRVQLAAGQTAQDLVARTGAEGMRRTELAGYAILRFSNPWRALEAADRLNQAGTRADVMLERVLERLAAPNDPFFPEQWHLRNTGQGGGILGVDANVVNAWDVTRGAGVTIVVVDDSLQTTHPDLAPNTPAFDSGLHFDFRDGDIDPRPADFDDRHGTAVAGVAAARQNNALGTSGSGPESRLLGVRLIGSPVSDQDVADALRWEPDGEVASISNNSWGYIGGPALRGIDLVMQDALRRGATEGRGGLGQVTLFANGNAQQSEDDGNYSTLQNSRYVAAIGAVTNFGEQSFYSTPGANVLVSAPSNGGSLGVFTTDVTGNGGYNPTFPGEPADRNYTNSFGGTSSATPLTSGGVALLLSANPNLGWRDVHEILAQTARKIDLADPDWADNGAGFHFNHRYGAGMIDLTAAVVRALDWNILAAETTATQNLEAPLVPAAIPDNGTLTRSLDFSGTQNVRVERVEVVARITHGHRSDLDIELVSPSGKRSLLAARHSRPSPQSFDDDIDYDDADGQGWSFTTTHHWGENSQGIWQLNVHDRVTGTSGSLEIARVNIFGTPSEPQRVRFAVQRQSAVENIGSVLLRVERLYGAEGQLAVDLETSTAATGNAAVPGEDYEAIAQRLVFEEGETFKEIPFVVQNDDLIEGNKYAYLTLKNVTGGSLGGNSLMRVDIVDDESNVITVVPGDVDVREKDGAPDVGTFIVARSKATSDPVVVNFTISGTATEGTDYQNIPSTVTIAPDEASVTVTVAPVDDEFLEGTETVIMTIEQDPGYAIGVPAIAQLNIIDNDLPLVEIRAVDNTAEETGLTTGLFRVSRKHPRAGEILPLDGPLAVNLEVGGSAQPSQNYVPIEDRTVIEAGSDHVDIVVTPIDDQEYRASQVVVVKIAPSAEYGFGFSTQDAVNIVENEPLPDNSKPTVTILSPPQNAQITSPAVKIDLLGTATDNQQVARVTYQVNEGPVRIAGGTTLGPSTPWSAEIVGDVLPGVNILRVQSFDQFDNPSAVVTRTFIYVEPHQLTVSVEPGGKITTEFQGVSTRNAGLEYTIVAQPVSKQFVFAGWSGDLEATGREFTFTMPGDDINLVANFVPNPFSSAVTGRYQGIVHGEPFGMASSGFVDIQLTKTGAFSASVTMGSIKYRFKGEFTADQPEPGKARFRGSLEQKNSAFPLILDFIVDMSPGGTQRIEGSISPEDAPFNSAVSAEREFFSKSNPYAPAQSKPQTFTMVFPAIENATNVQPHGLGWATLRIDRDGGVKWSGVLPDGTKVSQSTFLRKDLTWPIFLELYKKQGVILGSVAVDDQQPDNDLHGQVDWFKADTGDKLFPSKFTVAPLEVIGSLYTPPAKNVRVLPTFDGAGTVEFREGFLTASNINREFSASMTLSPSNQGTIAPPNPQLVEVTIAPGTGTFRGSFVHPHTFSITRKRTPFSGVIFQRKQPGAMGQFIGELPTGGTFQTGQVLIAPNAAAP